MVIKTFYFATQVHCISGATSLHRGVQYKDFGTHKELFAELEQAL